MPAMKREYLITFGGSVYRLTSEALRVWLGRIADGDDVQPPTGRGVRDLGLAFNVPIDGTQEEASYLLGELDYREGRG